MDAERISAIAGKASIEIYVIFQLLIIILNCIGYKLMPMTMIGQGDFPAR